MNGRSMGNGHRAEHWQTLERYRDSHLISHQPCPTNGSTTGNDYSLFITNRFLTERRGGRLKVDAITVASSITVRAVV